MPAVKRAAYLWLPSIVTGVIPLLFAIVFVGPEETGSVVNLELVGLRKELAMRSEQQPLDGFCYYL